MIRSIGRTKYFNKNTIAFCIIAGIVAGLLSQISWTRWTNVVILIGAVIFGSLMIYKYHWIGILNIFLLSMVKFEPAPSDILFIFLCIFGIIGGHLDFYRLKHSNTIIILPTLPS